MRLYYSHNESGKVSYYSHQLTGELRFHDSLKGTGEVGFHYSNKGLVKCVLLPY